MIAEAPPVLLLRSLRIISTAHCWIMLYIIERVLYIFLYYIPFFNNIIG